ncbi:MAG: aldo/keto reductase, partial [Isosphaeraceae bacterium]
MDVSLEAEYVIVGLPRRANPSDSPVVGACFLESACLGHFRPALNRRNPATPWNQGAPMGPGQWICRVWICRVEWLGAQGDNLRLRTNTMIERGLGKSGLRVSAVGLGCMGMSEFYEPKQMDDAESIRVIHRYLDAGGNLLDTADIYG